ncbi:hypothetical protein BJV77DRAFT_999756 [Russula vinacea]|nr:hypothetical protein BJV77DRAFT_999756 [Russula vinacea]
MSNDREPIVPETTLALPSRSFSGIRWNRTLHCRGESRSPFRVKTGHFSIYVYVYVTHCLIIQLKLLGCENDVLIMTALDLPFSSRVLAVSCAPFSFSTPFRLFLQCVSRHRRDPCSASALVLRFHEVCPLASQPCPLSVTIHKTICPVPLRSPLRGLHHLLHRSHSKTRNASRPSSGCENAAFVIKTLRHRTHYMTAPAPVSRNPSMHWHLPPYPR